MQHPLRRPRLPLGAPGLAGRGGVRTATVVEDLLDGLHHVLPAALQHQLQHAPLVTGEDAGQDVDGVHVSGGRRGRRRLQLVLVCLGARVGAQGTDRAWGVLARVLRGLGQHGGADATERLAVAVLGARAAVPNIRGGDARHRIAVGGDRLARVLWRGVGPGQLALAKQLVLVEARIYKTNKMISERF